MSGIAGDLEARADKAAGARDFVTAEQLLSRAAMAGGQSVALFMKLTAMRRGLGNLAGAIEANKGALRIEPLGFMPLLMRASLLQAAGREDEAAEAYAVALHHAPPIGTLPPVVRAELDRARAIADRHIAAQGASFAQLAADAAPDASAAEARRLGRFRSNVLRTTRAYAQEPSHFHFPELPVIEFFDRAHFPFFDALEANAARIRAEFEMVMHAEAAELVPYVQYPDDVPLAQWAELNRNRQWTAIHLVRNGVVVEANARHCPLTLSLFEAADQPQIAGRSPNLMFSLLAPRTHIPAHTGVANTRLVAHLPLIVPPGCRFRVGAETRDWVAGEAFAFDDTIEHEAWNDSDQLRVVLIGDLWRPELTPAERAAVTAIMAMPAGELDSIF